MKLRVRFVSNERVFKLKFGEVFKINTAVGDLPEYFGDYVVIPSVKTDKELETAYKFLTKDVVLKRVPYAEVSNGSKGITATIGNEV